MLVITTQGTAPTMGGRLVTTLNAIFWKLGNAEEHAGVYSVKPSDLRAAAARLLERIGGAR